MSEIKVYVASKSKHGPTWQMWREVWTYELPDVRVTASWIDESGPGETLDMEDLWRRCINEASACDLLLALYLPGEDWKGALLEIGAALGGGADVVIVAPGDEPPGGSWIEHERVRIVNTSGMSPGAALVDWLATGRWAL